MTEYVRELSFGGTDIKIYQESVGDVNCIVWDSALVCCYYFTKNKSAFEKLKVVELGAGTAVCSLTLASMGCEVEATDLPEYLGLIEKNIGANSKIMKNAGGSCVARALDWNDPWERKECDLLLLVDCIYYNDSIEPLIRTIKSFAAKRILCAYEIRDCGQPVEAQKLFADRIKEHFDLRPVSSEDLDPEFQSPEILLLDLVPNIAVV